MEKDESKQMTRREFLTWVAAAAALMALPAGRLAHGAAPAWAFADLGLPAVDMPGEVIVNFPDPPPPIVNPPGVTTTPASAPAAPYTHGSYAQYGAYSPQMSQGYEAVPTVYQKPAQTAAPQRMRLSAVRQTGPAAPAPAPTADPTLQFQPMQPPAVQFAPPPGHTATAPQPARRVAPTAVPPQQKGKVTALSRKMWAQEGPNPAKMRAMGQVKRITIHHEGSEKPNNDTLPFAVVETLRRIHGQHRKRMGAGDIGYHFIIDRTGMIWQGRNWMYQGAHTSGANANNLGVMLLGNFEIQRPTQAQLTSMHMLVSSLVRKFGLDASKDIYGHCDFCSTQCPGTNLRPQIAVLRRTAQ